jgi:hypothetical protein
MKKLSVFFLLISFSTVAFAQQWKENAPCSAYCIDATLTTFKGRMPKEDSSTVNLLLPCGNGTSEDNPIWWRFRPTGNKITFSFKSSNCSVGKCGAGPGAGVQLHLYEGDECGKLVCKNGNVGTYGSFGENVVPSKKYYLQLDGLCGCQCDFEITYDKTQIVDENCKNTVSVINQLSDDQINIYPNPATDKFTIELSSIKNATLDLYNTQGQIVLSQKSMTQLADNQYEANVTHLPKGVYFLKINLDENVGVRKIVVE